jgi:cytochrome c biogenesis protein CcdA/thiol-disulfide isomerase/thioredoxin
MLIFLLAYLGGVLTILSPCILPVLPFVFGGAGRPFRQGMLPLLGGMALTFALFSSLAVVGGSWVVQANQWGRWLALGVLSLFALTLLSPALAERLSRPFIRLGGTLHQAQRDDAGAGSSFLLGIATGMLWAPCAGPILGLILTGAALRGASANTALLLLAYALGAVSSLAAALAAGGKILQGMKRYLGADVWVRRVLGVLVLLGVAAILLGWDRGVLTRLSKVRTEDWEQSLIARLHPENMPQAVQSSTGTPLASLSGATGWINSEPLTPKALHGKVVLIDFWTYSCINCLRTLPYIKAWDAKYRGSGLVIIGVHTPEFAFEKDLANVQKAVRDLGITYPVALDSRYAVWNGFENHYWPAHYFFDAQGRLRGHHFGEGEYDETEKQIQALLAEAHGGSVPRGVVEPSASSGAQAPSSEDVNSPETYIGTARAEHRVNPDQPLALNQWSLSGAWSVDAEHAVLKKSSGKIRFRFHARDLHLVLGGKPTRFIVRVDGAEPGENHGMDIDAAGRGRINGQRLYQLIRQKSDAGVQDRTFEIEFLDPGAEAFAFTFG